MEENFLDALGNTKSAVCNVHVCIRESTILVYIFVAQPCEKFTTHVRTIKVENQVLYDIG